MGAENQANGSRVWVRADVSPSSERADGRRLEERQRCWLTGCVRGRSATASERKKS